MEPVTELTPIPENFIKCLCNHLKPQCGVQSPQLWLLYMQWTYHSQNLAYSTIFVHFFFLNPLFMSNIQRSLKTWRPTSKKKLSTNQLLDIIFKTRIKKNIKVYYKLSIPILLLKLQNLWIITWILLCYKKNEVMLAYSQLTTNLYFWLTTLEYLVTSL